MVDVTREWSGEGKGRKGKERKEEKERKGKGRKGKEREGKSMSGAKAVLKPFSRRTRNMYVGSAHDPSDASTLTRSKTYPLPLFIRIQ